MDLCGLLLLHALDDDASNVGILVDEKVFLIQLVVCTLDSQKV